MDEDLKSLIKRLKDEAMFVQSEKKHLVDLYDQLIKKSEKLFNKQWLISKHHSILDELIFGRNKSIKNQCKKFSLITNNHQFIESYKILSHFDYYVSEFLKSLRDKPQYLANLILKAEKINSGFFLNSVEFIRGIDNQIFSSQNLIQIVFQSLYGNCVLVQDESLCLQLLKNLLKNQFCAEEAQNVDLRKLIRKQSCSFNILFKTYTSFSHSAQLFLITALHEPINQILTDEWFLDIDPDKAMARFSAEERINKFGHPSTKEYKIKTQKYREKIVNLLYNTSMSFIDSISSSLYAFPPSMTWLVNQFFTLIGKTSRTNSTELARKLCCDLIMALYICPAICDPEPYGVLSDVQISNVARHNLMQIANILQVLAMSDDDKDPKAQDLYSKFRNNDKISVSLVYLVVGVDMI
ncbi:GTPase-activating and VPS9 domain-containing 1-like isoform X1 [Brachionus plicatilis]|uniref:GTPase-activating and VPS9 domain-containing 1-like isoform X1 n=1 Tax=Brachionus plicatilis TaxID=10195 RepID=A0A3M7QH37_BRAPC|nr:GTPase-activating and VPS9 domain-containing 1-like isoform X1 [Brachionus plicatilis]